MFISTLKCQKEAITISFKETLQTTSFANHQPDPAFQLSETAIFTPDFCKASLAAIRFIRLATKPALTSTPVLFVKARAVAEKLFLLALKVVCTW